MKDYEVGDKVVLRDTSSDPKWEYGILAHIIDGPMKIPLFGKMRPGFYEIKPVDRRRKPVIVYRSRIRKTSEFPKDFKLITGMTSHIGLFDVSHTMHYKEIHD